MFNGVLKKMITEYSSEIKYYLVMENDFIFFNSRSFIFNSKNQRKSKTYFIINIFNFHH